jgi:hypothetical protein
VLLLYVIAGWRGETWLGYVGRNLARNHCGPIVLCWGCWQKAATLQPKMGGLVCSLSASVGPVFGGLEKCIRCQYAAWQVHFVKQCLQLAQVTTASHCSNGTNLPLTLLPGTKKPAQAVPQRGEDSSIPILLTDR